MIDPRPPLPPVIRVRPEREADATDGAAARAVSEAAFPTDAEAKLLDALRASGDYDSARSLLAEVDGRIAGHVLLTAVTLEHPDGTAAHDRILALGPIAVVPVLQFRGVGSALVRAALEQAEREGMAAVVVLGHPSYYPRFGFRPARAQGLHPPGPWPDTAWMACRLPASTADDVGVARYAQPFMEMD